MIVILNLSFLWPWYVYVWCIRIEDYLLQPYLVFVSSRACVCGCMCGWGAFSQAMDMEFVKLMFIRCTKSVTLTQLMIMIEGAHMVSATSPTLFTYLPSYRYVYTYNIYTTSLPNRYRYLLDHPVRGRLILLKLSFYDSDSNTRVR